MKTYDTVTVTTTVAASPLESFDIFTNDVDLWWRRGPRYRMVGEGGTLRFEVSQDGIGRRLVEQSAEGELFEVGRVLVWEPARRLVLEWRARNFKNDETTEVEVRFDSDGDGTRVQLVHRGWAAIREDHPARQGVVGDAFVRMIAVWWGELGRAFRTHTVARARHDDES